MAGTSKRKLIKAPRLKAAKKARTSPPAQEAPESNVITSVTANEGRCIDDLPVEIFLFGICPELSHEDLLNMRLASRGLGRKVRGALFKTLIVDTGQAYRQGSYTEKIRSFVGERLYLFDEATELKFIIDVDKTNTTRRMKLATALTGEEGARFFLNALPRLHSVSISFTSASVTYMRVTTTALSNLYTWKGLCTNMFAQFLAHFSPATNPGSKIRNLVIDNVLRHDFDLAFDGEEHHQVRKALKGFDSINIKMFSWRDCNVSPARGFENHKCEEYQDNRDLVDTIHSMSRCGPDPVYYCRRNVLSTSERNTICSMEITSFRIQTKEHTAEEGMDHLVALETPSNSQSGMLLPQINSSWKPRVWNITEISLGTTVIPADDIDQAKQSTFFLLLSKKLPVLTTLRLRKPTLRFNHFVDLDKWPQLCRSIAQTRRENNLSIIKYAEIIEMACCENRPWSTQFFDEKRTEKCRKILTSTL